MANIDAKQVKELREISGAGMMDCKKALVETNGNIEEAIEWLREKGIAKATKKASRIAAEGLTAIESEGNKAIIVEVNAETDFVSKNEAFKTLVTKLTKILLKGTPKTLEEALNLNTEDGTVNDIIISATTKIGEKISLRRFEVVTKEDSEAFGKYLHMGGAIASLVVIDGNDSELAKDIAMHAAAMRPTYLSRDLVDGTEIEKERKVLKEQAINEGKPENIAEKMVEGRINKYYKEICLNEQAFIKDGDFSIEKYLLNKKSKVKMFMTYEVGEGIEKRNENFADEVMNQING